MENKKINKFREFYHWLLDIIGMENKYPTTLVIIAMCLPILFVDPWLIFCPLLILGGFFLLISILYFLTD